MSDDRLSHRHVATTDLDRVIDQVAREMTDGAPPEDLGARVVARIAADQPRTRMRLMWTVAPIAAAALLVIALVIARGSRSPGSIATPPPSSPVAKLPSPHIESTNVPRIESTNALHRDVAAARTPHPPRAVTPSAIDESDVAALAPAPIVAPPIAIPTLTTESLVLEKLETPASIAIAPLATPEGERP
jgi:hypothetical protein